MSEEFLVFSRTLCGRVALVPCITLTSKTAPTALLRRWEQSTDELHDPTQWSSESCEYRP